MMCPSYDPSWYQFYPGLFHFQGRQFLDRIMGAESFMQYRGWFYSALHAGPQAQPIHDPGFRVPYQRVALCEARYWGEHCVRIACAVDKHGARICDLHAAGWQCVVCEAWLEEPTVPQTTTTWCPLCDVYMQDLLDKQGSDINAAIEAAIVILQGWIADGWYDELYACTSDEYDIPSPAEPGWYSL